MVNEATMSALRNKTKVIKRIGTWIDKMNHYSCRSFVSIIQQKEKTHFINQSKLVSFCHSQTWNYLLRLINGSLCQSTVTGADITYGAIITHVLERTYLFWVISSFHSWNVFFIYLLLKTGVDASIRKKLFYYCNWNIILKVSDRK